ncbi:MAG: cyclic nucleotide-binding domain-containing protein [Alphaproteobacteria bacterium]|nr:cyclic nucleotide-binding domain-containing protein [Alphaproteobacteria bacterium]
MADHFTVAIIGSGPGGLSAAGRAAAAGVSHILLERCDHASDTIYKYQKGKLVMATPDVLPLRSDFDFKMGIREDILGTWDRQLEEHKVNIRYGAEVVAIAGQKGAFTVTLQDKSTLTAEYVILAIGLQGNINKLPVPGAELPHVQYQLDDPDEYEGEHIVVVGAGDAAIENAVALAKQNSVTIVNRSGEFARAKQGNLDLIRAAIEKNQIECYYNSSPARVTEKTLVLRTADGEAEVRCDRVIARLGATAPRKFVEACGIVFPSPDPKALPEVSSTYESNVPGLYIIGALGGYPLIKQAMNQGYEVIEFIRGNKVEPADEPLLKERFKGLADVTVEQVLATIRANVPIFSELNPLVLRELMLDSIVHTPKKGDIIFRRNDYSNSFYTIVQGEVEVRVNPLDDSEVVVLRQGEFFGEMGLIAGRRRTATVVARQDAILVETQRRTMLKLIASVASVKRQMDAIAIVRQIQTYIAPHTPVERLYDMASTAKLRRFKAGEILFSQGDAGDSVHLIRSGSVTVSRRIGGRDVVLSYVASGNYVGEMALLTNAPRSATVRAAVATETVAIDGKAFVDLLGSDPALRTEVEAKFRDRLEINERMERAPEAGSIIQFLIEQGVGEATDVLLIDESLCVRCDNCEKACAETHHGISRLDREAGPTFASIHVPTSCRHCEHPHCMADCPPDAIHRAPNGEVYIDDSCIGCGNCQRNCPYGVIQMAAPPPDKPGLFSWLLFGLGYGPGEDKRLRKVHHENVDKYGKHAVKCDMCKDIEGGAACVRACPTGAAIRVDPKQFLSLAKLGT